MSLGISMQSALTGLLAAQRGLDLVAQNVANANTEGYTRKTASVETLAVAGDSLGVILGAAQREVDEAVFRSLLGEKGLLAKLSSDDRLYTEMQKLFGAPGDETSVSHSITKFNEALETLATQPSKPGSQTMAVQAAVDLVDKLGALADGVQDLRVEADRGISDAVLEINTQLEIIAELNATLTYNKATHRETADLEDRRDQALLKLSELIDINYYRQGDGSVVIYTGGGRVLLDRDAKTLSHIFATLTDARTSYAAGHFDGIWLGDADITSEIRSGKLKSLIEMRDKVLPDLQAEVDTLAARLKEEVNQAHNRATSYPQLAKTLEGTRRFIDPNFDRMQLTGDDDVAIVLYDDDGNPHATTTLRDLMGWGSGDTGFATIGQVQSALNDWVSSVAGGSVTFTSDNRLTIDAGAYGIGFRDLPGGSLPTATEKPADITVEFDASSDGSADEVVRGFSYFFGLNDLFVDHRAADTWDSEIIAADGSYAVNLTIRDADGNSMSVNASGDLEAIAEAINDEAATNDVPVTAAVVPEGAGCRLRITQDDNADLMITGSFGELGLHRSAAGTATNIAVREEVVADPGLLGRGVLQGAEANTVRSPALTNTWTNTSGSDFDLNISVDSGVPVAVTVVNGADLAAVATAINGNATLTTNGVSASVITEPSGLQRLVVTGPAGSQVNVTSDDPATLSLGHDYFLSEGDNTGVIGMSETLTGKHEFANAGRATRGTYALSEFAGSIISLNAGAASAAEDKLTYQEGLTADLEYQRESETGVNLDEEMNQMLVYQQAYAAAAKVIATMQKLFEILDSIR